MKILGMIISMWLITQSALAQPLEYNGDPGFCQRIFTYIKQPPNFLHRTRQPLHRVEPPGYMGPTRTTLREPSPVFRENVGPPLALPLPVQPRVKLTHNLPYIHSVYIRGGVDLQIMGCAGENKISVQRVYPGLVVKVCDGAIYISNTKPVDCNQNPRPCIRLFVNELRQLVVAGDSCVNANHLNSSCGLTINHCGSGLVCINGPINIAHIINVGSAVICIRGVTSDHVHIQATRSGTVKLFGSTGLLLVRAFEHATVDTRFLCAQSALVQADNESLVTVKALRSLRAFAGGMSNVYYYTEPGILLQHTTLSGNIFYMGS